MCSAGWATVVGITAAIPRWVRILVYLWVASVVLSRGCSMGLPHRSDYSDVDEKKLAAMVQAYRGNTHPGDIAKLGAQIANQFADGDKDLATHDAVFAIPFGAPADDPAAAKLADAAFAQTFGRLAKAHRGQVGWIRTHSPPTMRATLSPARAPTTRPTWSTARSYPRRPRRSCR